MLVNSVIPVGEITQELHISRYNLLSCIERGRFTNSEQRFGFTHEANVFCGSVAKQKRFTSPMVASFLLPRKAFAAEHIMICELYQGKHAMIPVRFLESLLLDYRKSEDIVVTYLLVLRKRLNSVNYGRLKRLR